MLIHRYKNTQLNKTMIFCCEMIILLDEIASFFGYRVRAHTQNALLLANLPYNVFILFYALKVNALDTTKRSLWSVGRNKSFINHWSLLIQFNELIQQCPCLDVTHPRL